MRYELYRGIIDQWSRTLLSYNERIIANCVEMDKEHCTARRGGPEGGDLRRDTRQHPDFPLQSCGSRRHKLRVEHV